MEQATQASTPTAAPAADSFEHALAVVATVMASLTPDLRPFAVEVEEDFPAGYRVHLKYRAEGGAGLYELAAVLDVPVTRADTAFGVHLDVIARVRGIEVRGSALISVTQAAVLEGQSPPIPVPLSSSVVAEVSGLVHVPAVAAEHLGEEDEARCVRCGCTENAACKGGCYWVANRQMVDLCSACASPEELAAVAYVPASAAVEQDGGQ